MPISIDQITGPVDFRDAVRDKEAQVVDQLVLVLEELFAQVMPLYLKFLWSCQPDHAAAHTLWFIIESRTSHTLGRLSNTSLKLLADACTRMVRRLAQLRSKKRNLEYLVKQLTDFAHRFNQELRERKSAHLRDGSIS